ncbi:MAG: hypothetical protein M0Z47_05250 [Actinomycetota bacterium]|nr:hypothetical protein [Actinomycetota bacterium]
MRGAKPLAVAVVVLLLAGASIYLAARHRANTSTSAKTPGTAKGTTPTTAHTSKGATSALPGLPAAFDKPITSPHLQPGSNPSVLPGPLLIADRSNNRLIVVSPKGQVLWQFPRPGDLAPGQTFLIPDDAFFTPDGKYIIVTEEDDFVISVISIAQHRIIFRYGTPGQEGMGPNQLWNPDDAMMLPDGYILSPDIKNCRILLIKPGTLSPVHIYGLSTNACYHNPPARFGSPNGSFPMTNGHYVVTEINGDWVDEMGLNGTIYQSFHAPGVNYPSDTNEVRPGVFLTADYSKPGTVEEFTSSGQVLWRYSPTGAQALNQPSLALPLPNGDVILNDDKNNRVIVVDPKTNQVVWQYGTGVAGSAPGQLSNPDGLDLAPPFSLLVAHAATMGQPPSGTPASALAGQINITQPASKAPLKVVTTRTMPQALQRVAVAASGSSTALSLGGLDNAGNSVTSIYRFTVSGSKLALANAGSLAQPTHDAGAARIGSHIWVFGGGQAATITTVQSSGLNGGTAAVAGNLPQPRSDLAATGGGGAAYVAGGYDGTSMDAGVLKTTNGRSFTTVGSLVFPVRYGASVLYGDRLYVFGGESGGVTTSDIQAVNVRTGQAEIVGQLPVASEGMAAVVSAGDIYLLGGSDSSGNPQSAIWQFDPGTAMVYSAGSLPVPLAYAGATSVGSDVLVVGGKTTGGGNSSRAILLVRG